MAGASSSSDSFPLLETADWFQELSLGSDASEAPRNHYKGSLQQHYGHVPCGAYTAPSSHGSERKPNLNVGNVINGGDPFGSYPWGYYPSGGYQDQSFGYGHNNNSNTFSHLMMSYSEDDVHNSIKHGVWSSTPTGNKKLNAAYYESQESCCPVYLLFSVNASGQFVGVAEMTGPVDFNKTVEYWQQDKWIGCFPVKWRIIKDVPNSFLRHVTIANNENKPVTNSRDTQEVSVEDGTKIIKIFKEYMSKTCILDDFKFYETRQNMIRDKKIKQKKQVLDGASVETIH
ncbi:hypothetical protein F2Q70_00024050 [Brassica cretica]|uniref:YTH domain-containing family protein n=1 Tax=Brassica cretica TaxID=69181 RepID=A0A8S9GS83_BRACR|nr:hypothetical protein F2Q70_00024050 [Brassica cretica]